MATAINNPLAEATVQANAPSLFDTDPRDLHVESQTTSEDTFSIDKINDTPSTEDISENSQSQKSSKGIDRQHSHNNENVSANDSAAKRIKKKYRNFLDIDSDTEDNDIVSSLLDKSNSDKESNPNSMSPGRDNTKTSNKCVTKGKRYGRLIDSDSDEDDDFVTSLLDKNNSDRETNAGPESVTRNKETLHTHVGKGVGRWTDSDSDNDIVDGVKNSNTSGNDKGSSDIGKKKISTIIDSESEDNNVYNDTTPSSPTERRKKGNSDRKKNRKVEKSLKKSKLSAVIDTDSENDNEVNNDKTPAHGRDDNGLSAKKNEKSAKKRTGSQRASKEEAMRQIHSETQRLLRSSEVSLPYHRPKQRSLQDFLNRKNFIPALPEGLTTAAKVKMSSEIVGKALEEKEKEAELFYKSSDSEDETNDCTPENFKDTNQSSRPDSLVDQIAIEETQKILKNGVQNAHNKKEVIKQGAVDLGVPRKLFIEGTQEFTDNDAKYDEKMEDDEDVESEDPRKKTKEIKHGLREVSVPRKLFSSDCDEGVGSPWKNYDVSTLVTSKNTNSESSEMIHGQTESIDEGIDSLEQENDFFSRLGSSTCDDNDRQIEGNECNMFTKETAETSNISETPFISNKDICKISEKDKPSRQSIDRGENLFDKHDLSDPRNVLGHVIGLPPPDMDEDNPKIPEKPNVKNKVLSSVSNVGPKLRGAPGMVIDLSDDVKSNKDGVKSLLDRFYRHSAVNKTAEVSAPVTVLHTEKTADGLRVVEQILPYKLPKDDHFNDKELSKPGAKYARLKSELIEKMAKKRGDEWKLKEQREKEEQEECDSEDIEDESDGETDVKITEEEIEFSGESEPEEDDMPERKNKKKKPSEFVDEEAEVSGEENDEVMQVSSDEDEERDGNTSQDDNDETGDNLSDLDAEEETAKKNKKLTRIVKAFEDDSNSLPEPSSQSDIDCQKKTFQRTKTDVDMFETEDGNGDWQSDTESELPPSQILPRDQADARSQLCKTPLTAINVLRFVSPITQLTALNSAMDSPNDGSMTKSHSASSQSIVRLSIEKTPVDKESPTSCDSEKRSGFQKKLFQEPAGTVNDEELMDLCSGSFTGIETNDRRSPGFASHGKLSANSQASQLLGLSSGSFFSQAIDSQKIDKITKPDIDDTSQDIRLTLDDDSREACDNGTANEVAKESSVSRAKYKVASSSDNEDEIRNEPKRKKILKKKKVKQLQLSDDEDEAEFSNVEDEEEYDLLGDNDTEDKYVDYDSEENEVVIVPKKDIKKVAANFLDAEAELSESEWGSADEDEKDLDKLELEEGDNEEIDEKQMRDQLGKMHMRQILDDDRRDVRMLQELLFDDGDLHTDGNGRERKFKWKNIDKLGEDGNIVQGTADGDENGDQVEEENDLEWRKLRLERDKFIQEQMKIPTDEIHGELIRDSTIFKLGIKALNKKKSSHGTEKESNEPVTKKPVVPRTVMDLLGSPAGDQNSKILHKAVKRGSFLARGDESLARLAVQIKNTETTIVARQKPGNFVFAHISPSVAGAAAKKQKLVTESEAGSSGNAKARKRKPPVGITPRTTKKAKIDVSNSTGKKLF